MSTRQTFEEKREILCSKNLVKLAKQEDALSKSIKAVAGAQEKGALRALLNGVRKDIKATTKELDGTQRDIEWQRTVVLPLVDYLIETAASWKGASITPEIVDFLKAVKKYGDLAFKTYDKRGDISKVSARLDILLQTSPNSTGQAIEVSQWYPLQKERQAVADFMWDTLVSELTKESKVGTFQQYATDTENLTHFMDEYSALA